MASRKPCRALRLVARGATRPARRAASLRRAGRRPARAGRRRRPRALWRSSASSAGRSRTSQQDRRAGGPKAVGGADDAIAGRQLRRRGRPPGSRRYRRRGRSAARSRGAGAAGSSSPRRSRRRAAPSTRRTPPTPSGRLQDCPGHASPAPAADQPETEEPRESAHSGTFSLHFGEVRARRRPVRANRSVGAAREHAVAVRLEHRSRRRASARLARGACGVASSITKAASTHTSPRNRHLLQSPAMGR